MYLKEENTNIFYYTCNVIRLTNTIRTTYKNYSLSNMKNTELNIHDLKTYNLLQN